MSFFSQGCSSPSIPPTLSRHAAKQAGFRGPVLHSSQFRRELDNVLASVKAVSANSAPSNEQECVIVVGGGKSAQEFVVGSMRKRKGSNELFLVAFPHTLRRKAGKL